VTCPICARGTDPKYHPFCSRRCADADLGNWLTGRYAIPVEASEVDAEGPDDDAEDPGERH
jgi:uncharacterized protein